MVIKRIVEVSSQAHLRLRDNQLIIERNETMQVPIEDLGILILDHHSITHTQQLLCACWQNNVAVVVCDERHLPGALLLPLEGHSIQSRIIANQINVGEPAKKRIWQNIVRAKIRGQARVLDSIVGDSAPLLAYVDKVKSGDPDNIEAQVARIYWQRLFGPDFRRQQGHSGINILLNYGYAIVRAAVARALVGAGLHPSIGVHHHNQYDALCLADDLVEPLRPLVDLRVYELRGNKNEEEEVELSRETKRGLLDILTWNVSVNGQTLPLMVAIHNYAASVRDALCGEAKSIAIPAP